MSVFFDKFVCVSKKNLQSLGFLFNSYVYLKGDLRLTWGLLGFLMFV